jgi:leucyl aminopeptidase
LPSDIIHSYSGTSIEIIDTDAEGRLSSLMEFPIKKNYKPEYIVDITLTGSGTLGYECGALFTNEAPKKTTRCRDSVGERLWQLPLWDVYKQDIESDIADVKIIAVSQLPAISAAKFLEYFTKDTLHGHI